MTTMTFTSIFNKVTAKVGSFSTYAKTKSEAMKAKWNSPEFQSNLYTKGSATVDKLSEKAIKLDDYRHKLKDVGPNDPYKETWAKYSQALGALFGGSVPQTNNSSSFEKE